MNHSLTDIVQPAYPPHDHTRVTPPIGTFAMAVLIGAVVLFVGSFAMLGRDAAFALPPSLAAFFAATFWLGRLMMRDFPHGSLGLCNIVTLTRLVIVGVLFTALLSGLPATWVTLGLAILALSLDGIDGWLARKQRLASAFGARFDVEVDAAFALLLAVTAAVNGAAAPYVVLLGLPYYLFGVAKIYAPWLDRPLPESFGRKVVCVFQIAALIALQVPFLADGQLNIVIAAVTAALLWSFGRDTIWLWRQASARVTSR